ncbi:uncharacterized protein [Arachis hypogaea]|uniref:uncharacterized protein n=1 Tax=Arachis hypogaea TaxID=3818 RepID=UPI003B20FD91
MTAYYRKLKVLWDELAQCEQISKCTCDVWKCGFGSQLEKQRKEDRVHQFLMGLDDASYGTVRSNILVTDPLPTLNRVYAMLVQEERVKTMAKASKERERWGNRLRNEGRDGGKGYGRQGTRIGVIPARANVADTDGSGSHAINTEDKRHMINKQKPNESEKMTGKRIFDLWIIDSGASNYMTGILKILCEKKTIRGCPVGLLDREQAIVCKQGTVIIDGGLELKNVLYVPKLKCNLLSVSQLTEAEHCLVQFTDEFYVIQDRTSRTLIGVGEQKDELYWYRGAHKIQACHAKTENQLVLWHKRLGYPSFKIVQMLPNGKAQGLAPALRIEDIGLLVTEIIVEEDTYNRPISESILGPITPHLNNCVGESLIEVSIDKQGGHELNEEIEDYIADNASEPSTAETMPTSDLPLVTMEVLLGRGHRMKTPSVRLRDFVSTAMISISPADQPPSPLKTSFFLPLSKQNKSPYFSHKQLEISVVVKMVIICTTLAVAAARDWKLHQMNVHNVFLHGELDDDVYMKLLSGFQVPQQGLDHSLFSLRHNSVQLVVLVYVDDLVIVGNNSAVIQRFKEYLHKYFHMKDLGRLKYFLGVEVARSQIGIFLCQRKYILDIITEIGLLGAKLVATLCEENDRLRSATGSLLSDPSIYRRLVGRLIYLCFTRPDLAYNVHMLSQFMQNPCTEY